MKDQLISFEAAKLAKEIGFNIDQLMVYNKDTKDFWNQFTLTSSPNLCRKNGYLAPTQSLLQKWLRDTHNIHIEISLSDSEFKYDSDLYIIGEEMRCLTKYTTIECESYEEALERAIKKTINLLLYKL